MFSGWVINWNMGVSSGCVINRRISVLIGWVTSGSTVSF